MPVTLVRHTQPDVPKGLCYGRMDVDLASTFEQEAREVLAQMPRPELIACSPLLRCRRLADFLAQEHRLRAAIDERLIEMDFGSWEGLPWSEVPRTELDAWSDDFMHGRAHGGESVAMLRERTHGVLADYQKVSGTAVLVTHAGVIKAAVATGDRSEDWTHETPFGGMVEIGNP